MELKVWIWLLPLVAVVVAAAVLGGPLVAILLFGGLLMVLLASKKPKSLSPVIVLVGMLFSRPNIWGEQYSNIGLVLFSLAAIIAVVQDQGKFKFADREFRPLQSPLLWVVAAYLWLILRANYKGLETLSQFTGGLLVTAGCVLAVLMVAADRARRLLLAKGFVAIVALCCLSYVVTAVLWAATGVGSGVLASIQIGAWPQPQPVYFPFTTTVSTQSVLGYQLPRFVGIGREPGWMALYGAVAMLLLPLLGWHQRVLKLLLVVGVCGTLSTAGFGILFVCLAFDYMLNGRSRTRFEGVIRFSFGLLLVAFAGWVAFYAPVLGIGAKGEQNGISLSERTIATDLGIWALNNDPFSGGLGADKVGAVNLIAAIAAYGVPFSLAVGLGTISPLRFHPNRRLLAPLLVALFLTLLTSQPALDSAWIFALVVLCSGVALNQVEPTGGEPEPVSVSDKLASSTPAPARDTDHASLTS